MSLRRVALAVIASLSLSGCGKSNPVLVKAPLLPIYVCSERIGPGRQCIGRFDAGPLIGLPLAEAEKRDRGRPIRCVDPSEALTGDYVSGRIDVECTSGSSGHVVVRIVGTG